MNKFGKAILTLSTISLALVLMLILTVPALAEVVDGDPNAIINEDVDDDLFVGGNFVEINSTINGDVFAAGQDVIINGHIKGNLIITGQYLVINGRVDGSVFAGGMELQMDDLADIGGSLYFGGFSVVVGEKSEIARSLYAAGYQTEIAGRIYGNSITTGASYHLTGEVHGDVRVEIDNNQASNQGSFEYMTFFDNSFVLTFNEPGLFIDDDAIVKGEVFPKVTSLDIEIPDVDNIVINTPELVIINGRIEDTPARGIGHLIFGTMRKLIGETVGLTLLGLVFLVWIPGLLTEASETMDAKLLPNFGWGLIVLVLSPFVFLFVFFLLVVVSLLLWLLTLGTLSGEIIAILAASFMLVTALFGLAVWWLSKLALAYWVGRKLVDAILPKVKDNKWGTFWAIFFGVLIYSIVRAIPILGGIFAFFVIVFGVGVIFNMVRTRVLKPKAA